jgi:tetratricopeptide (TPR) repeat protein
MNDRDEIPLGLRDEFNQNFGVAFDILRQFANIPVSGKESPGFMGKKRLKEAITMLGRCLEIHRGSWQSMWGLGKAHQALGNHLTALGWFERALKIEEGNPDVWREATIESLGLGEAEKALTYAKNARELKPDDAGLQANLALALLLNKKGDEALSNIKEAYQWNPDDSVNKNVLALIQEVVSGKKPYPDKI